MGVVNPLGSSNMGGKMAEVTIKEEDVVEALRAYSKRKKGGRRVAKKKRKVTAKQRAAARRNIKKAQAALRKKRGGGRKRIKRRAKPMARRRKYTRRRRSRRRGMRIPPLFDIAAGINAAYQFGMIDAGKQLMAGDLEGAALTIRNNAGDPWSYVNTIIPWVAGKGIAKVVRAFGIRIPSIGPIRLI